MFDVQLIFRGRITVKSKSVGEKLKRIKIVGTRNTTDIAAYTVTGGDI